MPTATCCADMVHCCPSTLPVCDTDTGHCLPPTGSNAAPVPWATKQPALRRKGAEPAAVAGARFTGKFGRMNAKKFIMEGENLPVA
jgi:hypothetical protein